MPSEETRWISAGTLVYRMALKGWDMRPKQYVIPRDVVVTGTLHKESNTFEWVRGGFQYTALASDTQPV
jgi:hypothetical protein